MTELNSINIVQASWFVFSNIFVRLGFLLAAANLHNNSTLAWMASRLAPIHIDGHLWYQTPNVRKHVFAAQWCNMVERNILCNGYSFPLPLLT